MSLSLRVAGGLNTITQRDVIVTSTPVILGLRNMRAPLVRTTNHPKGENYTVSLRHARGIDTECPAIIADLAVQVVLHGRNKVRV